MFIFLPLLLLLAKSSLVSPQAPQNIFILAGQSNMSGRGGVRYSTWDGIVPDECRPSSSILKLTKELQWMEAVEPLHKDIDVYATCGIGPGMSFANAVLAKNHGIGPVGLVPCAVGATKITQWAKGTDLYEQLVRRARAAVQTGGRIRAMLWYQGESDTIEEGDASLYQGRLERFFMDLRADLQSPELLIIQVGLASGQGPYIQKVRDAQMKIHVSNVRYVDGKGLQLGSDYVHLTTSAQVRLGKLLANSFLQTLVK